MKYLFLNEHTDDCNKRRENYEKKKAARPDDLFLWPPHCGEEFFIFQTDFRFYALVYNGCFRGYQHHLDFKEEILRHSFEKKNYNNIHRSQDYINRVKENLLAGLLNKDFGEIISTYGNNAGKKYAFVKYHSCREYLEMLDNYHDNYKEAIATIEKNAEIFKGWAGSMRSEIEDLYFDNYNPLKHEKGSKVLNLSDLLTEKILKHGFGKVNEYATSFIGWNNQPD